MLAWKSSGSFPAARSQILPSIRGIQTMPPTLSYALIMVMRNSLGAQDRRVQVLDDELLHGRKEQVAHEGLADRLVEPGHLDVAGLKRLVAQGLQAPLAPVQPEGRAGPHDRLGVSLVEGDHALREEFAVEERQE